MYNRTQELQEANLHLQQANENLRQFASIASHDLQEPLRKVRTFAAMLKRRFAENMSAEQGDLISKISASADRMSQLIKEVLEYSKLTHASRNYVTANLDTILKDVLNDLDLLVSEKDAVIHYEALPVIEAIPLQMNQLFSNILTNALKFQEGSSKPVIDISFKILSESELKEYPSVRPDLTYLQIRFSDNGIGFDQEFADQIFQLFERLHPVEAYEGTGLGLALCKKIVENHHGHIFAVSKEAEGTSIYVMLPLRQSVA